MKNQISSYRHAKSIAPRLTLIASILGSLSFSAHAQQIVLDGTSLAPQTPITINTGSTAGSAGYAILASNAGHLTASEGINVLTAGNLAHGIALNNNSTVDLLAGGTITINGTGNGLDINSGATINSSGPLSITSNGRTTYAAYARNGSSIALEQGEIVTKGINGTGVAAASGSHITLNGTNITTTNNNARAVLSSGLDSLIEIADANISTEGTYTTAYTWGSRGVSAEAGGAVKLKDSTVSTLGRNGFAVYASGGSNIEMNNTTIETQGATAYGLRATGASTLITSTGDLTIDTFGDTAHAASATQGATINLGTAARLGTQGIGANALNIITGGGTITAKDLILNTTGNSSRGVYVDSYESAEGTRPMAVALTGNSGIHTLGEESYGIWATGHLTDVDVENLNVTTEGTRAYAINAQRNATVTTGRSLLSTTGDMAYGAVANLGSTISIGAGSLIKTQGQGAFGLWAADLDTKINAVNTSIVTSGVGADTVLASQQATLTLSQQSGQLISTKGINFSAVGGTIDATLDGSYIANSGLLISSFADANGHQGNVNLKVSNLAMQGDILADTVSVADLTMRNVQWRGYATHAGQIDLDPLSRWDMTYSSDTANINNSGSINFINTVVGNSLTVHGNYVGNNGHLKFNTVLGDDDSVTDKLVVEGDTSGITNVSVKNIGGSGAETLNGIELIQVNGLSEGEFRQSGRIVAGAYEYSLARGSDVNASNWYLTSTFSPSPGTEEMVKRPEAGSYIANLSTANNLFVTRLHDRLGETQYIDALTGEKKVTSLWLRNEGGHNRSTDSSGQLNTQSNRYVVQLGGDIAQWSNNDLDRWHLGLMAGYANSKSRTRSFASAYSSNGSVDGYNAGVYATWYANDEDKSGLYTDSWLQYSWFNNRVNGQDLATEKYKSKGLTASLESGYTFKIGENTAKHETYFIQPKVQAIWMGIKADDHREANGTKVNGQGDGNIQTRLGVKAYINGHHAMDNGKDREFQPFIEANWIHNSRNFATTMNGVDIQQAGSKNIGELKLGVEGKINNKLNMWGNVAQQVGSNEYRDTAVILGVKYNF